MRGWLIFRHETKLLLLRRLALKKALWAEAEQRRLDEVQDLCDHFEEDPINVGRTSAGGVVNFLNPFFLRSQASLSPTHVRNTRVILNTDD